MNTSTNGRNGNAASHNDRSNSVHSHDRRNKRFQACLACRATKTKCLPSMQEGTCQACLKSSRPCTMPGPPKPRIKSAQKFSELEKKIERLTNALAVKDHDQEASESSNVGGQIPSQQMGDCEMPSDTILPTTRTGQTVQIYSDVLDEGLVTQEIASNLYLHWQNVMRIFSPVASLTANIDVDTMRKTRPMLFLTILTIASSAMHPSLSNRLVKRLTQELGQQIFVHNHQTVDIILASLLFSQYFFQNGHFTTFPPSHFIYTATALSNDLGLYARARGLLTGFSDVAAESAQVCLAEWYAASTTAVLLHRVPVIRQTAELERFMTILESRPGTFDNIFFSFMKLQRIVEAASLLLNPVENRSENAFDEPSTQYQINMFLQQLDSWKRSLPDDFDDRIKRYCENSAYLRIHEIAVRCFVRKVVISKQTVKDIGSGGVDPVMGLSPALFDTLTKCINSIKSLFDIYLSFDLSLTRSLPNSYLFWNMTASVLLIKLGHFGDTITDTGQPSLHSGSANTQVSFKATVVRYLDAIAQKMEEASSGGHLPQARPYIAVVRKLKPYYLQKRAICISADGDAIVMDEEDGNMLPFKRDNLQQASDVQRGSIASKEMQMGIHGNQQNSVTQSSPRGLSQTMSQLSDGSHSGWTPSSGTFDGQMQTPSITGSYVEQVASPAINVSAAQDPYTYASTDWTSLTLDEDTLQQLDSFMWDEEDTTWMLPLL